MDKKIVIDGRELAFEGDKTILQVARENNIYIPSLCYHPKFGPSSNCRVCMVEVEGMRGMQASCGVAAADGMRVHTNTPVVLESRRTMVDLLLSNGNHDCLSCEVNGVCELQDAAYHLGIEAPSFIIEQKYPRDLSAAFIMRDPNKCILCGRCIEGCNQLVVNEVLSFAYRGFNKKVVCDTDLPMGQSTCVQCGECVQLCPVGALIDKKSIGKARAWETRKVRTTCPYCGVGCQLNLHVKGDRIVRVTGVDGAEPNQGHLCVKGRYGYDFVYASDRLTTPLIREGDGFREASWDEALDLVANKFKQIIRESGPDAIAGVSCSRSLNENSYAMQKMLRGAIGTNNVDNCART